MENQIIQLGNFRPHEEQISENDTISEPHLISPELANAIEELILKLRSNQPMTRT